MVTAMRPVPIGKVAFFSMLVLLAVPTIAVILDSDPNQDAGVAIEDTLSDSLHWNGRRMVHRHRGNAVLG